jgi:hypothetical protein
MKISETSERILKLWYEEGGQRWAYCLETQEERKCPVTYCIEPRRADVQQVPTQSGLVWSHVKLKFVLKSFMSGLQIIYCNIYMIIKCLVQPNPLLSTIPCSLTSLLVVANTHPPLSLVCQQLPHPWLALLLFHTPQFRLHYLHRRHQQLQSSSSGNRHIHLICIHNF